MTWHSRSEWGAAAPTGTLSRFTDSQVAGVVVHWNGVAVTRSTPEVLRADQRYHQHTRGWSDIAYNAAADQAGDLWEARGLAYRSAANGSTDTNARWVAIVCLIGPGQTPTPAMEQAVRDFVAMVRSRWPAAGLIRTHNDVRPEPTQCPGAELAAAVHAGRLEPGVAPEPPTPQEDDMKTTLVAGPDGRLWTLTVNALHQGKRHVSSPARLADILFLDQVTLGATLVSQTPVNYGADYLAEYPTVGEPAEVHVSITDADVARIAQQVAELAKLSPENIKALAGGVVAGLGSALSNG